MWRGAQDNLRAAERAYRDSFSIAERQFGPQSAEVKYLHHQRWATARQVRGGAGTT
jgi:hypothetical protein